MTVIALILVCCAVFVAWSWVKPRHPSPPPIPGALPLIGHLHQIPKDPVGFWRFEKEFVEFTLKNGGISKLLIGMLPVFVITDPDDSLLLANSCLEKPYAYSFGKEIYGRGLLTANVSTWKLHRKLLNPAFNQQVLNSFLDIFNDQARTLVSRLETKVGKGFLDVGPYLISHSMKTACQTTLGSKTDDESVIVKTYAPATEDLFELFMNRFLRFWLHLQIIFDMSSLKKKQNLLVKTMTDVTYGLIKQRKTELKQNKNLGTDCDPKSEKFKPFLDQMLHLAETEGSLTDDVIREHLDTIIVGAFDTTANSLQFILILIASHQDVQSRIIQELQQVFENQDINVTKFDLSRLDYLEAVIKESLRLYPIAARIARRTHSDVKLKDYIIPANSICMISTYGINRHPMWGADADQFKPERWLDPATLPDNPNAFASFSLGRRNCIGKKYAMMLMKTTIAHIIRRYHITRIQQELQINNGVILNPASGHHMSIEIRK